jgi:hypothetical protein
LSRAPTNLEKQQAGGIELVGFNTGVVDHGIRLMKKDEFQGRTDVDPQPSPAMAGGLFSVHREYFFEIGIDIVLRIPFFSTREVLLGFTVSPFLTVATLNSVTTLQVRSMRRWLIGEGRILKLAFEFGSVEAPSS